MAFHKAHGDLRKMAGRGKARARFTPDIWKRWLKEHNERMGLRPLSPLP